MRYLPHTPAQRARMLDTIGVDSVDALFKDVPANVYQSASFDLPDHQSELAVERHLSTLAAKNKNTHDVVSFMGCGAYHHHIPASVDHLIQRGEFLTSYTPYQPEVSQGTLQYLFEFQTLVNRITGMEVSNASMYDGSTACVEAVQMAMRVTKKRKAVVSANLHPQYREIIDTHARLSGFEVATGESVIDDTSCVMVQYPDFYGNLNDFTKLADDCHAAGALLIVAVTEVVALGALKSPGSMGADIVVCEGQSLGNPLGFGGPYVGLFSTRQKYVRQMPGRLVGETKDTDGTTGYVLTLATREQHIRRDKATSNICTNAGLCALAFTIHLSLLGESGFQKLAALNHARAVQLKDALEGIDGVTILNDTFFNEFTIQVTTPARELVRHLADKDILAGVAVSRFGGRFKNQPDDRIILAATELTTDEDIASLAAGLKEALA